MRTRAMAWRSSLFLCAAALAAAALGLFEPRPSQARSDARISLLVKCDRAALPTVLRGLASQGAEAWNLDTMRRLTVRTPVSTPARPTIAGRTSVRGLPDATRVMQEILIAFQSLRDDAGGSLVEIEEMAIQERRATIRCIVSKPATFDEIRRLLSKNAYLMARVADAKRAVEPGAMQTRPDGRYKQSYQFKFHLGGPPTPTRQPQNDSISTRLMHELAVASGLRPIYAGPVNDDPNRGKGFRTISREYTFAPTRLAQLMKFLARVSSDPAGLTVFELRWKLADPKERKPEDLVKKPVVKVGVRVPILD